MMFFMQPSKYPKEPYTEHMAKNRMHLYTCIQLGMFALLYVIIATKVVAIIFPFIILMCIPMRLFLLPKIFTKEELLHIDSDEDAINQYLTQKNMHESTARGYQSAKLHGIDLEDGIESMEKGMDKTEGGEADSDDNVATN
jgi:hypothetical protein